MPKKQQRNAFYFFMKELEPQLRREGRVFPNGMADIVPIAHPRWKQLPEKEKLRFEMIAKQQKARLRGQAGDMYREDNVGNIIARRVDKYTELEKRRMAERQDIIKNWPAGKALKRENFYFINFQYLCKTEEGDYLPVEIAVVEYSIEKGITKKLHRFIEPGKIPTGYRFTCIQNSEDTHKIPIENFEQADSNYRGLWIQLENFINPNGTKQENPPLYCLGAKSNYEAVESCLNWIHGKACLGEPNRIRKVYEVETLFKEMQSHIGNQVSKSSCIDTLTSSDWDYDRNTKCDYHEEHEVKDCALAVVQKYGYVLSDALCEAFDVTLTKNHFPVREETGSITVLSPSSMAGWNKQEPRMPPTSDLKIKREPKPRPPEQEDYRELRRPNPPVPDYPASLPTALAFGGANLGGAPAPMGGVYVNQAAASGGRGLSVIMEGLNFDQMKNVGRGFAPQPLKTPLPPQAFQQPQVPFSQQPMGIGRGMARNVVAPPPLNVQIKEEGLAPLRHPGQMGPLAAVPQQQYSTPQQNASQFADVKPEATMNVTIPVCVGHGGLLEGFMKHGKRPGVMGKRYAPPDWVHDEKLKPIRR